MNFGPRRDALHGKHTREKKKRQGDPKWNARNEDELTDDEDAESEAGMPVVEEDGGSEESRSGAKKEEPMTFSDITIERLEQLAKELGATVVRPPKPPLPDR